MTALLQGALRMQADMDATKKVRSVAKKAQDLYRHQQKIERDVKARYLEHLIKLLVFGRALCKN